MIALWATAVPNLWWAQVLLILLSTAVAAQLYQQSRQLESTQQDYALLQQDVDELNTVQTFTAALNAAQNMDRLQATTMQTLTGKLGYKIAIMGLVDHEKKRLTG